MDNKKILLNKYKSKNSSNVENLIGVELKSNSRIIPTDRLEKTIDEYKQYLKEKKASSRYRLSFDINPYCTNVLFNNLSEIVYKEGSDECIAISKDGTNIEKLENVGIYHKYKGYDNKKTLTKYEMIRDTSYSHPEIGPFVYHCGYDIFNNHTLRKKEFGVINKMTQHINDNKKGERHNFNTIGDYKRYHYGEIVDEDVLRRKKNEKNEIKLERVNRKLHQYQTSNILSFNDSIDENLLEENGWFGFINKTTIDIPNYVYNILDGSDGKKKNINISLNKCMNNNKSNEFYDMYPDRSLFSFTPKINKYRNRKEYNWDYCLTYPYDNFYDNELVQYEDKTNNIKINGLKVVLVDEEVEEYIDNGRKCYIYDIEDNATVTFKTIIKNSFDTNCLLEFILIGEIGGEVDVIEVENLISVKSIGYEGEKLDYYFSTYADDIIDSLNKFDNPSKVEIRVRQVKNGGVCEYYFRRFKKITNPITNGKLNSSINRMGFSKTIYGDGVAQILFNDDVMLGGLRDNLGRSLSEIFLTIVRNNKGYKEWYDSKNCGGEDITFSHCFGKITSGIPIEDENVYDYNIHKMHNLDASIILLNGVNKINNDEGFSITDPFKHLFIENEGKYRVPKTLEDDINFGNDYFLGDIVEFSSILLDETVLENVHHRFNTVQREMYNENRQNMTNGEFTNLYYDVIKCDDYDIFGNGFEIKTEKYNAYFLNDDDPSQEFYVYPANIAPEGYYYNPHYKIQLKEYRTEVKEGAHTMMNTYSIIPDEDDGLYIVSTAANYYPEVDKNIFVYDKITREQYNASIESVGNPDRRHFKIRCKELELGEDINPVERYLLYKPNVEKPSEAYELNDGSGTYVWREEYEDIEYLNTEIGDYTFTNGAHYINKKINFHLKRQDPDGRYGLNNVSSIVPYISSMSVGGYVVDHSGVKTNDPEEFKMC